MTGFATDELISSTKLVRNFGTVLDNFKNKSVSKIGILKNNDLEAVIFSRETYDNIIDYIEDLEDIITIKEREENDTGVLYTHEEMLKKFNIKPDSL